MGGFWLGLPSVGVAFGKGGLWMGLVFGMSARFGGREGLVGFWGIAKSQLFSDQPRENAYPQLRGIAVWGVFDPPGAGSFPLLAAGLRSCLALTPAGCAASSATLI